MKLPFLNKSKKYISSFLVFVFIFGLFSSLYFVNIKKVAAVDHFATEVTQLLNEVALNAIAAASIATQIATTAVVPPIGTTAAATKVATMDQVAGNWWQRLVKWTKEYWALINTTLYQKSHILKEYVLDPLAWAMANVIIDQFGDAIVDWIRSGFDGSPMFLSDPEGFFRDTANQASGAIIDKLDMEWLCDPLGKLNINMEFFFPGTDRAKYACTFNDIADTLSSYADRDDLSDWINVNVNVNERNIVREFGNDYRNGGFLMWMLTADEKNNDLGRTLQTANDAYIAASVSVGSEKFQLNLYQGFFGVRKCVEYADIEPRFSFGEGEEITSGGSAGKPPCAKWETKTPGTLVQDQLNDVGGKDLSRLQVADEIDEIIGALATTMVGWLLTGGNDGGGVLGYDKNEKYSASNRDHYGALRDSQTLTKKKSDISKQIVIMKNGNDQYVNALNNHFGVSAGEGSDTGIVLAKLKCIRATSTNDTSNIYDDSACLGASEEIQNIRLENGTSSQMTEITADIDKIENDIEENDTGKYDAGEIAIATRTGELLDEFENEIMMTISLEETDPIISEYCYSYDETTKTGTVCGLYTDEYGNTKQETRETHSEEEASAIDGETMNKVPELKTAELEYLCILNKYTKTEKVSEGACKEFVKTPE